MPPKPKVTKKQILDKALSIVREHGIHYLTAKHLADARACSTQPIFWHYENMESLKKDIFDEAMKIFGQALRHANDCNSRYMALGVNYIRFAKEERELFRLLFMSDISKTDIFSTRVEMDYILNVIEESEHITGEDAQVIYRNMWLFTHGIAAMIATGTADFSSGEVRTMLSDVCRGLIMNLKNKKSSK